MTATSPWNAWAVGQDYGNETLVLRWNGRMVIHWYRGAWYTPSRPTGIGNSTLYGVAGTQANLWAVGQIGNQNLALRHC